MKIPLDHICVKSGVLCPRCQRLVDSRVVEPYEVDVMRALLDLEDVAEFRFLRTATYQKSIKMDNLLVLILQLSDSLVHPKVLTKLDKQLSDLLGIKVRVIDKSSGSVKTLVSQLIAPARVIGINTLWLPDGSIQYIVRIPRSDNRYLPASRETLEGVLGSLIGSSVRIKVE